MNPGGIRCLRADDPADTPRAGTQAAAESARPTAGRSSRKLANLVNYDTRDDAPCGVQ